MRIGAIRDGGVTRGDHAGRQVGMGIDGAYDGKIRAYRFTQTRQPESVQIVVVMPLTGIGAMWRHQHPIERTGSAQVVPASMKPGMRAMKGILMPPSYSIPLRPRSGRFEVTE